MNDITIQDRVKRRYQQMLGGGHMVKDASASLARLKAECGDLTPVSFEETLFEPLGNGIVRMHLRPLLQTGLSLETANAMFVYSANHFHGDAQAFMAALDGLAETDADHVWLENYRQAGCPAVSHSEAYRAAYAPAYRMVMRVFADAFPLVLAMDRLQRGIVSIDGPCTSGKSTLAEILSEVFGASVLHVDDFFLQPHQRTPERLAEPGGNFDRERLLQEALLPLRAGRNFTYRPYNCAVQRIGDPVAFHVTPLTLVEGVYGQHPDLRDAYDLTAFLQIDADTQRERVLRRNGEAMLRRFEQEWIPMENAYFKAFHIAERADIRLKL